MLTGVAPFVGPTTQATLARRLTEAAPRLSSVLPAAPATLEQALGKLLARDPADRYVHATAAARALEACATAAAVPDVRGIRRWLPAGAVVVLAVLVMVVARRGERADSSALANAAAERPAGVGEPAWRAYQRGREQEAWATFEGYQSAIEFYRQAETLDQNFASAAAGIARAYTNFGYLSFPGGPTIREAQDSATQASSRAMAHDPSDPDVLFAAAAVAYRFYYDRAGALALQRKAVAKRPNDAMLRAILGDLLLLAGKPDSGLREVEAAVRLDSSSAAMRAQQAWYLYMLRRYDDAIRAAERGLVLDPSNAELHEYTGWALTHSGRASEAIPYLQRASKLSGGRLMTRASLGYAFGRMGATDSARAILRFLEQEVASQHASPVLLAWVQMGLGDTAAALTSFELGWEQRSALLNFLDLNRAWVPLHGAPRFEALRRKVGLSTESAPR